MRLTPIDVQQQKFRTGFRGYDVAEVQRFLELVSQQMIEVSRENNDLHSDIRRTNRELDEYREREATLKEAMLTAQRAIDEIREQAQKEAQLIVSEAELRAEKILHSAHARSNKVMDDIRDLRKQRTRAIEDLRHLLSTHQKILDISDDEAQGSDNDAKVTVLGRVRAPSPPSSASLSQAEGQG